MDIVDMIRTARRVYLIGNGGSYANALHVQNDLESVGIRAHTLNPSSLSRTANDEGYEFVFSRWVTLHGEPQDLLIAFSGSGTSKNIVNAIEAAKLIGMQTHLVTNYLRTMDMQASEEHQLFAGHEWMWRLKK